MVPRKWMAFDEVVTLRFTGFDVLVECGDPRFEALDEAVGGVDLDRRQRYGRLRFGCPHGPPRRQVRGACGAEDDDCAAEDLCEEVTHYAVSRGRPRAELVGRRRRALYARARVSTSLGSSGRRACR
jgi:hypothetical protein